jgi:hypothetical protein
MPDFTAGMAPFHATLCRRRNLVPPRHGGKILEFAIDLRLSVADSHNSFALFVITDSDQSIDLAYEVQESISVLFN